MNRRRAMAHEDDWAEDWLLRVRNLEVLVAETGRRLVAGVDLDLVAGESVAVVGESGSGKSLTARALFDVLPSGLVATGEILYRGVDLGGASRKQRARLRGAEMTMLLQDPFTMLHPMRKCGDQITETLRNDAGRRLPRAQRQAAAVDRLEEVGIADPEVVAAKYPFELSGGMLQRVAIAAALVQNPRFLIADEPSTALDVTTQAEILKLLRRLQARRGMAMILITHDLRLAFSICQRVYVLYAGRVVETSPTELLRLRPCHPYSQGLLLAEPPHDRRLGELVSIPGSVPRPDAVEHECAFAARCSWSLPECSAARPPLVEISSERLSACVRLAEISSEMEQQLNHAQEPVEATPPGPGKNAILVVDQLRVTYGSPANANVVKAVAGVSLSVEEGECVGLVGESGSGKTTLGRSIVGLVKPSAGTITVGGLTASDRESLTVEERRTLNRSVQMVFQDPYSSLNPARTVEASLRDALSLVHPKVTQTHIADVLDAVGLSADFARRRPVALSGGERQRVAIARAIAVEPRLLICDEPVSALDVSVQAQLLNLLNALRQERGIAYLFITHDLAVVRQIASKIYVMRSGLIVEEGHAGVVLDDPEHDYTRQLIASIPRSAESDLLAVQLEANLP